MQIKAGFEEGKDLVVSVMSAMGEEQICGLKDISKAWLMILSVRLVFGRLLEVYYSSYPFFSFFVEIWFCFVFYFSSISSMNYFRFIQLISLH